MGGISREGMWDELGWSEARKAKERQYLEREARESLGLIEPEKEPALTDA